MKYHLKTIIFSGQEAMIKRQGDALWDILCDEITSTRWTMADAVEVLMRHGFAHSTATQYARALIANVRAESGDDVIMRSVNRYSWA